MGLRLALSIFAECPSFSEEWHFFLDSCAKSRCRCKHFSLAFLGAIKRVAAFHFRSHFHASTCTATDDTALRYARMDCDTLFIKSSDALYRTVRSADTSTPGCAPTQPFERLNDYEKYIVIDGRILCRYRSCNKRSCRRCPKAVGSIELRYPLGPPRTTGQV
jgi:hypothetical protein